MVIDAEMMAVETRIEIAKMKTVVTASLRVSGEECRNDCKINLKTKISFSFFINFKFLTYEGNHLVQIEVEFGLRLL